MERKFELDPAKNPVLIVWVGKSSGDLYLTDRRQSGGRSSYKLKDRQFCQTRDISLRYSDARPYNELSQELKAQFAQEASPELLKMFQDHYEKPVNKFEQIKPDEWVIVKYNHTNSTIYIAKQADYQSGRSEIPAIVVSAGERSEHLSPNRGRIGSSGGPGHLGYSFSWLPQEIKTLFKKLNPELYRHFEQYYQQNTTPVAAATGIEYKLTGKIEQYNFIHFDGVMHIFIPNSNHPTTLCYNWATGKTVNKNTEQDVRGRVQWPFNAMPDSWEETALEQNSRMYHKFKALCRSGSDYDIDKIQCGCGLSFCPHCENFNFAVNPRTKSEQERMTAIYQQEVKPSDFEKIINPYNLTNIKSGLTSTKFINSPNNQQINEKFNLPTKIRSLPRGERLTSSIIQSPPRKNSASAGYLKYGTTVVPGRKPVRGR